MASGLKVDMPPPVTVPSLPSGTKVQAVTLTRMAADIAPGTPWLEEAVGFGCSGAQTTYWKESNNRISLTSFERVYREQLSSAGFVGGRDPNNLFDEEAASDLQAGALIKGLAIKGCMRGRLLASPVLDGAATMDLEWQIYSASKGKVVARITTHGGFTISGIDYQNVTPVITGVFADNVRRLAADPTFRQLATADPGPVAVPPQAISFIAASSPMPIAKASQAVVTIFAGDAWGSGIVISSEGYVLTNHHVVGATGRVRVRWSDGSESTGEVLRSDKRRDVALIRTAGRGAALALRKEPVVPGETVFAIGTPLEKDFNNTVTKGVVSATRSFQGSAFIQSDVAVDHGNSGGPLLDEQGRVVAITDWGYSPDGVSHNLNFFIPIEDALRVLGLTPTIASAPTPLPPDVHKVANGRAAAHR